MAMVFHVREASGPFNACACSFKSSDSDLSVVEIIFRFVSCFLVFDVSVAVLAVRSLAVYRVGLRHFFSSNPLWSRLITRMTCHEYSVKMLHNSFESLSLFPVSGISLKLHQQLIDLGFESITQALLNTPHLFCVQLRVVWKL
jgi:hypothetical protein